MNRTQLIVVMAIPVAIFSILGSGLTSCTKTKTVYDTTTSTITIRDTITVKDTVILTDTLGNLTDGLVAYYNFNGGSLSDSSGNGNDIYFNSATPTADRFGNPNNAYLFDGATSYMQVHNSNSINPSNITIYAIVKVYGFYQQECHGNQILSKGYPYDVPGFYDLAFFPFNNGTSSCLTTVDTTQEIFDGSFGDNQPQGSNAGSYGNSSADSIYVEKYQWYTLCYTYDGNVSNFYVNGALARSTPNANSVTFTPNANDLFIGKHENPLFPYYFNGVIDEIRIYNKAITIQQVGYLNLLKTKYLKYLNKLIY